MTFIAETQLAIEDLKMFLQIDSLEEIKRKLDKFYVVLSNESRI